MFLSMEMLQCGALLPTHCSTVVCYPKAFGNIFSWLTCFKHDTEAAPSEVPQQPLRQLAEQSQPPASE